MCDSRSHQDSGRFKTACRLACRTTFLIGLAAVAPAPLHAQVRAPQPQFSLNVTFEGSQYEPTIAADGDGRFVVTWVGRWFPIGPYPHFVIMRRLGVDGTSGPEVLASRRRQKDLGSSALASSLEGIAAVVWSEEVPVAWNEPSQSAVWLRMFDRRGGAARQATRVSVTAMEYLPGGEVAVLRDGTTMVVWSGFFFDDSSTSHVLARLFDASGKPLSGELPLSEVGVSTVSVVVTTTQRGDELIVGWSEKLADEWRFRVGRYGADGQLRRPAVSFGLAEEGGYSLRLAGGKGGGFLAAWTGDDDREFPTFFPATGVVAQAFGPDDEPLGPVHHINSFVPGFQSEVSVVADGMDGYFVAWGSDLWDDEFGQDGSGSGVFGRRLRADGTPQGLELQINTNTKGKQGLGFRIGLAANRGKVLVAWTDETSDPPGRGRSPGIGARWLNIRRGSGALCGDAYAQDLQLKVTDALEILRAAVNESSCVACLCDADGSGKLSAADAARVLARAIGLRAKMECPACPDGIESPAGEPSLPEFNSESRERPGLAQRISNGNGKDTPSSRHTGSR